MPCTSPNKVFYVGINPDTGKKKIVFASRHTDYLYKKINEDRWNKGRLPESQTADHGIRLPGAYRDALAALSPLPGEILCKDYDLVPCGQCIGCRLDHARSWAARMMLERKNYADNECWFVTFTYNDEHLPPARELLDEDSGEIKTAPFSSVSVREHQLLMKRIRKEYGDGIRFFMSGEYGSKSMRPHYHYILFGIKFDDLVAIGSNWRGDRYYTSPRLIRTCWSDKQHNEIGFVTIGNVDFDSCGYVARYTIKKQGSVDTYVYDELGIDPEFCLMSRRPGIGKEFFDDHYEAIYKTDEVIVPGHDGAITIKPPPYFDSLLERIDEGKLLEIKEKRKIKAENYNTNIAERRPGLDMEDLFESQERSYKNTVTFKKKGEL